MCLSSMAIAQDVGQPAVPAPAQEKKICRPVTPTGSIMPKRLCLTKVEWARFKDENERHTDMVRNNRNRSLNTRAMGD